MTPDVLLLLTTISQFGVSMISVTLWLYTPELYPTRMRALASGVGTAWYRLGVTIAPTMVGLIVSRYSLPDAFLMFGGVAAFAAIVTSLFAVETKGRVLEEVSP